MAINQKKKMLIILILNLRIVHIVLFFMILDLNTMDEQLKLIIYLLEEQE